MMHATLTRVLLGWMLLVSLAGLFPRPAYSQAPLEEDPDWLTRPVLLINVASIERSLNDISNMFQVSGRPDVMDLISGFLGGKAGDLKGVDRTRPLGAMVFLERDLPPRPRPVIYLPVKNEEELITTMRLGPGKITKTGEHEYEVETRRRKSPLKVIGGYAFFLPEGDAFLEGEELPDPEQVAAALTSRYDVAASISIRGIPQLIREVFATTFSTQTAAQLQQRDNEPDAAYQLRRANGLSALQLIEQLIRDGQEITLGIDSTEDGRRAVVEFNIDALPESEFAKYLTGIAGEPTYFEPLLGEQNPLQISASWNMDKRERDAFSGIVEALQTGLKGGVGEESAGAVERLGDSLKATAEKGHFDFILQFFPQKEREFVLIGGLKVVGGDSLGQALQEILTALSTRDENLEVAINSHTYQNTTLHKLTGRKDDPKLARIYGGKPDLYVGTGSGVLWFGMGCAGVLPALDRAIETTLAASPGTRTGSAPPFQVVFRMVPWLALPARNDRDARNREILQEAMTQGQDAFRVEARPRESGLRVTVRFDEGFVRLLGLSLARLYDRSQL